MAPMRASFIYWPGIKITEMKSKLFLLVFITLVVGFVIGMLTSAQLRLHKLQPVRWYFSEERFMDGLYKTIEPDEKQKAEIEKIIAKYARLNASLQEDFRKSFDSNLKEFRKELDSKLTSDQLARLREMDEKRLEMIRQFRRDHRNDTTGPGNQRRDDRFEGPGRDDGRPFPPPDRMRPYDRQPGQRPDSSGSPDDK